MAKLKLWKKNKSKDYKFLDDNIAQWFHVGGTSIMVHKYLGAKKNATGEKCDATKPLSGEEADELTIQDLLFLENRDRRYDKNVIELDGIYTVTDNDFTLSQFGLFLSTDTTFIDFHTNKMVERLGRKIIAGDVLEISHVRDDLLLDESLPAINAFYVVKDAKKTAEGYSQTWRSHIWRVRAEPIKDTQEFKDILENEENNIYSTKDILDAISDSLLEEANNQVDRENFDSHHIYEGSKCYEGNMLPWMYNGDGVPNDTNVPAPQGRRFPESPLDGDYFLRTDYKPARLFRWDDCKWIHVETNWRTPYESARRTITDFVNNTDVTEFNENPNDNEDSRQSINDVATPDDKPSPCSDNTITDIGNDAEEE